jgi:outer membrane protein assembly factor BamB
MKRMIDRILPYGSLVLACVASFGCGAAPQAPAAAAPAAAPAATPMSAPGPAEWPEWRGPERTGVSSETGLLEAWPAGGPPVAWKIAEVGSGFSSFSVVGGRIYIMTKREDGEYTVAYDAANGSEIWARRTGERYSNSKGGGPRATPTVAGDLLYVLGANGDLACLATKDGSVRWSVNVLERFGTENIKWGISESPLVDGDLVMVLTGSPAGSLVAFHRFDGKVVWQSAGMDDEPGYASALVRDVGGVRQVIHFTDDAAVGVRVSDGKPLWRYERAANSTANCATPVYSDSHVFVTSGYDTGGALLELTSAGGETTAREVYFTRDMMNHHGGVVLVDGYLYGFSNSILTCMDFKTGEVMWQDRSVGKGSLTAAGGMLYVLGEDGGVALVEAAPGGYREASRFQLESKPRKSWAYPVVAGGRLYIRNYDDLYSFDVKARG